MKSKQRSCEVILEWEDGPHIVKSMALVEPLEEASALTVPPLSSLETTSVKPKGLVKVPRLIVWT